MTYTKITKQPYVFDNVLEDTLISTESENRYLVHDHQVEIAYIIGDSAVIFHTPRWDYELNGNDQESPYVLDDDDNEVLDPDVLAILPVYGYVHGGVSISTGSYGCPWDSGQIGWAFITRDSAKYMGITEDTSREELEDYIRSDIDVIDKVYRGEVYTIVREELDSSGEVKDWDCVSGYFGYHYALGALKTDI